MCGWGRASSFNLSPKGKYVSVHQNHSVNQTKERLVGMNGGILFFFSKQLQLLSKANLAVKRGSGNSTDGNALL